MKWEDEGFVISKKKFRENAVILEIFTSRFGKVNGIVYGGNSRKIKNYLQIINKIHVVYTSKGDNRIGYFKTELIKAISPIYFDNKIKILCLKIYNTLCQLLDNFNNDNWISLYLNWEINLINNLGFGFTLDSEKFSNINEMKTINIKLDSITYKIPSFLISKNYKKPNNEEICSGLNFSRNLMENKFFIPNNIRFPYSRKLLEKKFL